MSIVEDVGAQVRATAEELPLGLLGQALEKFGLATERLRWVRQESANPMGVPELSAATEHAETAGYALRVAQEQLSAYLAAIGLAPDGAPPPTGRPERRPAHDAPRGDEPVAVAPESPGEVRLRRWWSVRVAELTGGTRRPSGGARRADRRLPRAAAPGGAAAYAPATVTGCTGSCAGRTPTSAWGWPRWPRRCCATSPGSCSDIRRAATTWPGCTASWTAGCATCCPACPHRCWTPC